MTATIDVYCQDISHPKRHWQCGRFEIVEHDPDDPMCQALVEATGRTAERLWAFIDPTWPAARIGGRPPARRGQRLRGVHKSRARIDPDGHYIADDDISADPNVLDGAHNTFTIRCRLCGLTFSRRDEPLFGVLDKLAAAGVTSISLSALSDTIGRSSG